MKKISLTGIKPTGTIHIGNYLGAIKPAIELFDSYDVRYFIADYHALNTIKDPSLLRQYTLNISACWLAAGLNADEHVFFKQTDTPELLELYTILNCFVMKSRLNGAHAYKAFVQKNIENKKEPDAKINNGLFSYPVLMAADILLYDSEVVPVGKDQLQHIEIAVDIAQAFNYNYDIDFFTIPSSLHKENALIPGLDGRKMSKSYDNTIPLFCEEKQLRKTIMKIVTNSQDIHESKNPDESNIFSIYKLFASDEQIKNLRKRYIEGPLGWGEAKEELFQVINKEISPLRKKYFEIIKDESFIIKELKKGAEKARDIASKKLKETKKIIGAL